MSARHWHGSNGVPHDLTVERIGETAWAVACSCGHHARTRSRSAALGLAMEHKKRTTTQPSTTSKPKPYRRGREQMPTRRFEV